MNTASTKGIMKASNSFRVMAEKVSSDFWNMESVFEVELLGLSSLNAKEKDQTNTGRLSCLPRAMLGVA